MSEGIKEAEGGGVMENKEDKKGFEGWAIVELFGHAKIAGLCSEQPLAGTNMLRVDVPTIPPYTKFYGGGAIYAITPTDEKTARIAVDHLDGIRPVDRWTVPEPPTPNTRYLPYGREESASEEWDREHEEDY